MNKLPLTSQQKETGANFMASPLCRASEPHWVLFLLCVLQLKFPFLRHQYFECFCHWNFFSGTELSLCGERVWLCWGKLPWGSGAKGLGQVVYSPEIINQKNADLQRGLWFTVKQASLSHHKYGHYEITEHRSGGPFHMFQVRFKETRQDLPEDITLTPWTQTVWYFPRVIS